MSALTTAEGVIPAGQGGSEYMRDIYVYGGRCSYVPTFAGYFSVLLRNYISSILADGLQ
jgi:hypothetical protein